MKPLVLLCAASLVAAPVVVVKASHGVAESVGKEVGALAAEWLAPLGRTRERVSSADPSGAELEGVSPAAPAPETPQERPVDGLAGPRDAKRPVVKRRLPPAAARGGGVRVSAGQVLALAERRAMPRAVPVPANDRHPAGLQLLNVSALGVGMRDGDILTRVAGVPATSAGVVVELVLRARARQAREVSAEFWRNGALWSLVVEQPYLTTSSALGDPVVTGRSAP